MVSRAHACLKANDRSYFAILKKEVHALAVTGNFSEHKVGEIDIVVAEIVTNLVKHAGGGQLLIKLIEQDDIQGIELISVDSGPGMTDVTRMVADGVSTKNTLGHGLGTMKRLCDTFQVYSQKNWGTIILCRLFNEEIPNLNKQKKFELGHILVPKPGETACGDGFCCENTADGFKVFMGDGLGHGPDAEKAITVAIEAFKTCAQEEPAEMIRYLDNAVKKTRGLVGTVAMYHRNNKKWSLCGVGNIMSRINSNAGLKNYTSYNGIIGLNVPNTMKEQEIEIEHPQQLILCSDGIQSRWDSTRYPAIQRYDPVIISTAIYKDFGRQTDDMSVAVCKINN